MTEAKPVFTCRMHEMAWAEGNRPLHLDPPRPRNFSNDYRARISKVTDLLREKGKLSAQEVLAHFPDVNAHTMRSQLSDMVLQKILVSSRHRKDGKSMIWYSIR
jgi:hypothetical protein